MISSAGIPTIPGNMDALLGHAQTIRNAGIDFADTGTDLHNTWQGLAQCYRAPESEDLLAATIPIRETAHTIGETWGQAAHILTVYAEEVRAIQTQLAELRARALDFETAAAADPQWRADPTAVDRNNDLIGAVAAVMAQFDTAQQTCAGAIAALTDDTPPPLPQPEPPTWGTTTQIEEGGQTEDEGWSWSDIGHTTFDVVGMVPILGEPADAINAVWYAAEGDHVNAALSAAAMVPVAGWAATGGKWGIRGVQAVRSTDGARAWLTNRPTMVPPNADRLDFHPTDRFPHGQKYRWTDPTTGEQVRYHAHGTDPTRGPTDNAGRGPTYRLQIGDDYLDAQGNRYPQEVLRSRSPRFQENAANDTHMPFPADQPAPDVPHVRVAAPNPTGLLGPEQEEV